MRFGSGDYVYEVVEGWGQGPEGRPMGIVSSMATDSQDRVYVIDREPNPAIVVFDREGRLLTTWGEDLLKVPHAIWINKNDLIYLTDCGLHTVMTFTVDGQLLSTIGTPHVMGAQGKPFNAPTWAVEGLNNDLYVSDGYGQNYLHRFTLEGQLLCSWGGDGTEPGQFDIPHCVRVDRRGRVLVVDRANNRVQIFDAEGRFLTAWTHLLEPNDLFIDKNDVVYLAEAERRVSILTLDGTVMAQFGGQGTAPGLFVDHPHGLWVDSHGDLYVCEVPYASNRIQKYRRV